MLRGKAWTGCQVEMAPQVRTPGASGGVGPAEQGPAAWHALSLLSARARPMCWPPPRVRVGWLGLSVGSRPEAGQVGMLQGSVPAQTS